MKRLSCVTRKIRRGGEGRGRCPNGSRKNKKIGKCEKIKRSIVTISRKPTELREKFKKMYIDEPMISKETLEKWSGWPLDESIMDADDEFAYQIERLKLTLSLVEQYIKFYDVDDYERNTFTICNGDMKKVAQHMLLDLVIKMNSQYNRGWSIKDMQEKKPLRLIYEPVFVPYRTPGFIQRHGKDWNNGNYRTMTTSESNRLKRLEKKNDGTVLEIRT